MDLSKVKWLVIFAVILGGGWLFTAGGVNYMYKHATSATPGTDAAKDKRDEATLSKYGGFLMATFRYQRAADFYNAAIQRYPAGANRYWDRYELARAYEKLDENEKAVDLLYYLWEENAIQYDSRVANQDELKLRIQKLIEVNQLDMDPFKER